MARIELVVIFAAGTLYLAVAARSVRANQLVLNTKALQSALKERSTW